jgi:hypothetical protein
VALAFARIEQNMVVSSWKDSLISSSDQSNLQKYMQVPEYGCFRDRKRLPIEHQPEDQVWENVRAIGGERGWYYANALWRFRGLLDKLVGGIGLRRGRTHPERIHPGDALDFWRVLVADEQERRLLLYAEMKLPGEAWLEFRILHREGKSWLQQEATFRPFGLMGRLYWYLVAPFHYLVFNGMIRRIEQYPGGELQMKETG